MTTTVNYNKGEEKVERILLKKICVTHNPRRPAPSLQDNLTKEGYEGKKLIELIRIRKDLFGRFILQSQRLGMNRRGNQTQGYPNPAAQNNPSPSLELYHLDLLSLFGDL